MEGVVIWTCFFSFFLSFFLSFHQILKQNLNNSRCDGAQCDFMGLSAFSNLNGAPPPATNRQLVNLFGNFLQISNSYFWLTHFLSLINIFQSRRLCFGHMWLESIRVMLQNISLPYYCVCISSWLFIAHQTIIQMLTSWSVKIPT